MYFQTKSTKSPKCFDLLQIISREAFHQTSVYQTHIIYLTDKNFSP